MEFIKVFQINWPNMHLFTIELNNTIFFIERYKLYKSVSNLNYFKIGKT